jgi:hypothetical protein
MSQPTYESRRSFLFGFLGTGAAAVAVSACELAVGGPPQAEYQAGIAEPAEVVPLRPGVRYAGELPSQVPLVRTLPTAGSMYGN